MGVSEYIKEYYEHYALAQKVYHSLTKAVNEEVSDDEARVKDSCRFLFRMRAGQMKLHPD